MPGMPRLDKKSSKIAFDIIGTPQNLIKRRGAKKKKHREKPIIKTSYNSG